MDVLLILAIYLLIVNLAGFAAMGIDKKDCKKPGQKKIRVNCNKKGFRAFGTEALYYRIGNFAERIVISCCSFLLPASSLHEPCWKVRTG